MSKHFTLSEAQTLLPVLEALLKRARAAALEAAELDIEMQHLNQKIFLSGGMHVDVVSAARRRAQREKAAQEMKDTLSEIEVIGVQVQDLQTGVLDFPCVADGEVVMLCWRMGEAAIGFWHRADEDVEARRLLDERFGRTERLN